MSASAALPRPPSQGLAPRRLRRVSTARETTGLVIGRVLPNGYVRPATPGQWRTVMREGLSPAAFRADRLATLRAVATALMCWTDWDTLTSRPTWAVLIEHCQSNTGRGSRRTIARAIATLIELRLIARVAHGRQGRYAGGVDPVSTPNEAAVYVLIVPSQLSAVAEPGVVDHASAVPAVDTNGTPPETGFWFLPRTRARGQEIISEPLRGADFDQAAQAPPTPKLDGNRHAELWSRCATTGSQGARLSAAAELQRRLPVLRQIGTRDLRNCLREFFLAGWTVRDVEHAIDWKPDGSRWPHDGARGIGPISVRAWLAHRLAPWTTEGTPRRSFTQLSDAERSRQLAIERARRERDRAERAANPPIPAPRSGHYPAIRAHLAHVNRGAGYRPDCPICRNPSGG